MLKGRKDDEVVNRLKHQLDDFKQYIPLLTEVCVCVRALWVCLCEGEAEAHNISGCDCVCGA